MEGFKFSAEIIRTDCKRSASICLDAEGMKERVPQSLSDHGIIAYMVVPERCRILENNHSRRC